MKQEMKKFKAQPQRKTIHKKIALLHDNSLSLLFFFSFLFFFLFCNQPFLTLPQNSAHHSLFVFLSSFSSPFLIRLIIPLFPIPHTPQHACFMIAKKR
jgi:hypothetical protein